MNNKQKEKKSAENAPTDFTSKPSINTDPLGSWTGTPDDPNDKPVQDADDL